MLLALVALYLLVSIAIGMMSAKNVHNARDYINAGRNLPMPMVLAMVFATWFGAETVLGISATFLEDGFRGLISDPLGASLCLVIFEGTIKLYVNNTEHLDQLIKNLHQIEGVIKVSRFD